MILSDKQIVNYLRPLLGEEKLSADEEIALPDQGFRVVKRYRLELDTDVLYEVYDVYPEDARTRFFTCEQIYYSRVLANVGEFVSAAARKLSFPVVYGGWSRHDRVAYWVRALYRLRHRTGETGTSEDDVFGPGLIGEMKQLDCEIDSILPDVLRALARMESMDPQRLIKSFNTRTGTSLTKRDTKRGRR